MSTNFLKHQVSFTKLSAKILLNTAILTFINVYAIIRYIVLTMTDKHHIDNKLQVRNLEFF